MPGSDRPSYGLNGSCLSRAPPVYGPLVVGTNVSQSRDKCHYGLALRKVILVFSIHSVAFSPEGARLSDLWIELDF